MNPAATTTVSSDISQAPSAPAAVDPHYLRDVTALGDTLEIRTRRAIWSKSRIKLVDKGVRVDSRLYERLMQHKLQPAIEQCLEVADAVRPADLRRETLRLFESGTGYSSLRELAANPRDILSAIGQIPMDAGLAFRMTVMRERRPAMYSHAVGVAALSACLARSTGMAGDRLLCAAAAGAYHDIGEMHLDPKLLEGGRPLDEGERRHIYTHPLTAYLVLQEHECCAGGIADAVLEHHERIDGSGYPRGICSEALGEGGRIVALAELAAAFFAQESASGALQRLRIVLQLNHRRFDAILTDALVDLIRKTAPGAAAEGAADAAVVLGRVEAIRKVVADWRNLLAGGGERGAAFEWAAGRMVHLERALLEAGIGIMNGEDLAALIEQDAAAGRELLAIARELGWLLQEIVNGVYRDPANEPREALKQWASRTRQSLAA
jgi:HD-GYP domain-containing protein (c-di-GMP phosphodiesterase class II)